MLKYCEICGKPFDATGTAKYCSATCRQEAQHRNRKAWEERTGYRDKRRNEAQEYNREKLEEAEKQAREDEKRKERNRKRRERYRRKKEPALIGVESSMALEKMKAAAPFSYEYWEAYQDYERGYAESLGKESRRSVNGISVNDDEFPLKVTISIAEIGIIRTEAY